MIRFNRIGLHQGSVPFRTKLDAQHQRVARWVWRYSAYQT
jgi:hypothetical protein